MTVEELRAALADMPGYWPVELDGGRGDVSRVETVQDCYAATDRNGASVRVRLS